ncbi:MAG TPA: DoxX family protein [Candidatus Limnocylindrales bacterium]|nr:DoxX family protein [Candidatus Limnocylindrales bacterium]
MYPDLGLLIIRVFLSLVVLAYGLQKVGFLGGYGFKGTAGWLDSIGFKPGSLWIWPVVIAEVVGTVLILLGLGGPIGPGILAADLTVAAIGFHSPNGFWNANGGWSWISALAATAFSLALIGFGSYSLDSALNLTYPDILLPVWLIATFAVAVVALIVHRMNEPAPAPAAGTDAS